MTQKLPGVASRPGMFISVGPSGFTVTALIGLAGNIENVVTADFMGNGMMAGLVARIIGYWAGTSTLIQFAHAFASDELQLLTLSRNLAMGVSLSSAPNHTTMSLLLAC